MQEGVSMRAYRKQRLDMSVLMKCYHHLKPAKHNTGRVTEFLRSPCIHIYGKIIFAHSKQLKNCYN